MGECMAASPGCWKFAGILRSSAPGEPQDQIATWCGCTQVQGRLTKLFEDMLTHSKITLYNDLYTNTNKCISVLIWCIVQ